MSNLAAAVLDTITSLVVVLDREGRIVRFNRACERVTGYSLAEVHGRVVWDLFPVPDEAEAVRAAFTSLLASRATSQHENHWRTRDGQLRAIAWSDSVLLGAEGEAEHVVGTGTDVTERRWAEEDLLRTNHALRALIEASPLAISVLDRDGVVRVWSPASERIFGWTRREALGRPNPIVPPDRQEEFLINLRQTLAGETLLGVETVRQRKDGSLVDVAIWTSLLRDAQDEPESILAVLADIGERKRAQEVLRASEAEFRAVFELAGVGKAQADPATSRFLRVNRKMCELTGYSAEELLGLSFHQITHPDDREGDKALFRRIMDSSAVDWTAEKRYVRKDGEVIWVSVHGSLIREPDGRPVRAVAVIQDITDRRRAEEELRAAKAAVEAASQAKDQFLAVLSHEMRTPLTPVLATVSALEMDPTLRREVRDGLAMIRRNVELEARLIDDLLDLTRIARGKLELHRQQVDTREILGHAVDMCCAREVAAGRLRLELGFTPGDYTAWADGSRVTQVFWNLLNNAVKFTPEGGLISVRSWIEEEGGDLAVEIADTGIGIEPERLPRVFDAFEQTDRHITRRFGGLGLGLAVSKAILELHGGSLTAASAGRGHGAAFTLRLPAGEPPADQDELRDAPAAVSSPAPPPAERALRILLVEDHADTAAAMADLLALFGHAVTVAGSVRAALAAAETAAGGLDLVVSDIGLPDGSGQELMRELTRRFGLRGIALSGYGMEEDLRKSREAGFALHLTKPVAPQTLRAAIQQTAAQPAVPQPMETRPRG